MIPAISRRSLVSGVLASGALLAITPAFARRERIEFLVTRGREPIGTHRIDFSRHGNDLIVDVKIDLVVEVAWVPVFRYEHTNHEVWRHARLMKMESQTHDDGRDHKVVARNEGSTLFVEGDEGPMSVEADILTTSYWHPDTATKSRLLDTQKGRVAEVTHAPAGMETLMVAGQPMEAEQYDATGDLTLSVWYSPQGAWCGIAFDARGKRVEYQAVHYLDRQQWLTVASMVET